MKRKLNKLPPPMIEVAKAEIEAWCRSEKLSRGLVMAILFAFIHRWHTGKTVEESFFGEKAKEPEYFI